MPLWEELLDALDEKPVSSTTTCDVAAVQNGDDAVGEQGLLSAARGRNDEECRAREKLYAQVSAKLECHKMLRCSEDLASEIQNARSRKLAAIQKEDYDAAHLAKTQEKLLLARWEEEEKKIHGLEEELAALSEEHNECRPAALLPEKDQPLVTSVPVGLLCLRVPHLAVRLQGLDLVNCPAPLQDLREGQVLVEMRAVPLSSADRLFGGGSPSSGDENDRVYGSQGVGQVQLLGPGTEANLAIGDWVVPLLPVDDDGDLLEGPHPGTGRGLAVYSVTSLARLSSVADVGLSIGQMAVAKSIGAAYRMIELYARDLPVEDPVIVNAANGTVGRVLVQVLALLRYRVFAVVRRHEGVELTRRRLESLGCVKALVDDGSLRARLEEMRIPSPRLAFDGVGGDATARLAAATSKMADIVCYGQAGGQQTSTILAGWKGTVRHFSLDEWLHEDLKGHSEKLAEILREAAALMHASRLAVETYDYYLPEFAAAMRDAQRPGRLHTVVLNFPDVAAAAMDAQSPADDARMHRKEEPYSTSAAAVASPTMECVEDRGGFEGCWTSETGEERATITGGLVFWADGPPTRIKHQRGKDGFSSETDGVTFSAVRDDAGRLVWSDGDVWVRNDAAAVAAPAW